jgi:hypothetical protein
MFNIQDFSSKEMISCGKKLREMFSNAQNIVDASQKASEFFYDSFVENEEKSFALSRVFKTHTYGSLPDNLKKFAKEVAGEELDDSVKCLTLLGTKGLEESWNSPRTSGGHKAIPLVNVDFVKNIPMIAGLITQLGLTIQDFINTSETFVGKENRSFNVFFVENAKGSPLIPAQDGFVIPYEVKSVVGYGGILPDGNFFTGIIFSRTKLTKKIAELFQPLAINVKTGLLPFYEDDISEHL